MYFESRAHAGSLLADALAERYRYENCVVVALSEGGVLVGEEIAARLHCILTMIVSESIEIPGENMSFGGISQTGVFSYNTGLSSGEIDEYVSEFHGYLEEQKREAFQRINRLIGDGGVIDADLLGDHIVILVSDGFDDDATIDVALDFLKPIRTQRLVVAAPVATVDAVDKIHVAADELHILDVKTNYLGVDHYYDNNEVPSLEEAIAHINQMILKWQ